ncbi:MAG: penicillin-binding protein activator [Spiribacter sp.]|nr:penicillin-binding protein activator [Spiribacter sp.]MDR9489473.1 penicillin-binding protein activator [Spiribacter sp.]
MTSLWMGILVVACAPMPRQDAGPAPIYRSPITADAEAALAVGDLTSAVTLLHMAAEQAPAQAAAGLKLEAAFFALQLNDTAPAEALISAGQRTANAQQRASAEFIGLLLDNHRRPNRQAELLFELAGQLPERLEPYRREALAEALAANDQALAALEQRLAAGQLHRGFTARLANEAALWQALMATSTEQLTEAAERTRNQPALTWLARAQGVKQRLLEPSATARFVNAWRHDATDLVAGELLATRILATQRAALSPARHVAVLLPLSGDLATAGQAIQRGILAAHHSPADRQKNTRLQFIDVGSEGLLASLAYRRAVAEGAGQVIGPLAKESVRELLNNSTITAPLIALNRIDDFRAPNNTYQFGLSPEDEAEAAAALVQRMGFQRIGVLGSSSDWGERVTRRFTQAFEAADGEILEQQNYPPNEDDMSVPIQALFNLDTSAARYARLRSITGERFVFEPRRRRDMQAVFLAAFNGPARLAVPQLRFHRGIGLPIFATSESYPSTPSSAAHDDLAKVTMPVMPWLLGSAQDSLSKGARAALIEASDEESALPLGELLALGVDSYRLLGSVALLEEHAQLRLPAATGELYINAKRQVKRNLQPATVTQDGLQALLNTHDQP